jgi:protein TonB
MSLGIFTSTNDRLGQMLFLATILHLFLILGVNFDFEDRAKPQHRQQSLEIMIVQHPKPAPKVQDKGDYLAQLSQIGGGNQAQKAKPSTESILPPNQPLPAPTKTKPIPQSVPETTKRPQKPVITQAASPHEVTTERPKPVIEAEPVPSAAQLFASKAREIAHLTAELQRKTTAYAKMPRRKAISANTKEYKYAAYLDAWRRKVERIGNLNYPDEAKRQHLYGNLILHVAVKKDGSVEQVRVLHSSGHKLLDDAAVRIVRLAAPFSPFPKEIREETDILDITRTWQFLRSNRLDSR